MVIERKGAGQRSCCFSNHGHWCLMLSEQGGGHLFLDLTILGFLSLSGCSGSSLCFSRWQRVKQRWSLEHARLVHVGGNVHQPGRRGSHPAWALAQ